VLCRALRPTYQRSWTRTRNYRSERRSRELVKKHDLSGVPVILINQFSELSVRAEQLDREIVVIQKRVLHVTDMDEVTFARWSFLVTEHRRCALAITSLAKAVFGEQHRPPTIDLVAEMSRLDQVEPVPEAAEPERGAESED
jgi:hypothetical protein